MNQENFNPNDAKLSALLHRSRSGHSLPPRFQEDVWRRIEESEIPVAVRRGWLDALAAWALRPRFALATAIVLVLAGSLAGARQGRQAARADAQSRYVASVAPNSLGK
ncbi:MAG TPA: hypothetical protein VH597_10685 [Verrucomicrobiae bacterium]|jgi:hypothetical protein|nr:hypothetical protein [Verrucomicrobiae bacterium]